MYITRKSERGASWAFSLVTLVLSLSTTSAFLINQNTRTSGCTVRFHAAATDDSSGETIDINSRRDFLRVTPASFISGIVGLNILTSNGLPALAAEEVELPTREALTERFDFIRYELNDPQGGVTYMQGRIDEEDFAGLVDFCKTYDLEFRKRRFGGVKKLIQDKAIKSKATEYANAVTFDLIGINRSCRKGQESVESANKYLQELKDDVNKFLALEETIEVKP